MGDSGNIYTTSHIRTCAIVRHTGRQEFKIHFHLIVALGAQICVCGYQ